MAGGVEKCALMQTKVCPCGSAPPTKRGDAMAICHISCKTVSHTTGRTAPAAAAYRAADCIVNETDGTTHDYRKKAGVAYTEIIVTEGTPMPSRAELWNKAERADHRKNSTVAREWEVALPCELSANQRKALAVEFGRWLCAKYGVAVDLAIHAPNRSGDQRNHHAHILTTTRVWNDQGELGRKTRELDDRRTGPKEVEKVREAWEEICNRALERAGRKEQISAGRLPKNQVATIHVGVSATAMTRHGAERSSREQHNDLVRELRELEEQQQRSEMEKRREAILAHPRCLGNNGAREMLTKDGWEQWVPVLEKELGIGQEPKPQPAKETTPKDKEAERIERECEAEAERWEKKISDRAKDVWNAADKAAQKAHDDWCEARDRLTKLQEQKEQLGIVGRLRGKDKELDAKAKRLTEAQEAAWARETEANARKDGARALAEKELRADLAPEALAYLDKCLARAKEKRKERDRQRAIEREVQREKERAKGRGGGLYLGR